MTSTLTAVGTQLPSPADTGPDSITGPDSVTRPDSITGPDSVTRPGNTAGPGNIAGRGRAAAGSPTRIAGPRPRASATVLNLLETARRGLAEAAAEIDAG
ncbi:MAG: hypothetical protein J2P26_13600, partial [Nocardiopsaceae bacterium]|nr:hypothetical protein [Nocardiopsaceae bacterium]